MLGEDPGKAVDSYKKFDEKVAPIKITVDELTEKL
jgi:hypothetical protein